MSDRSREGMTLIELMVVLLLLVLVFGMVTALLGQGQLAWVSESAVLTLQSETRQALQLMAREVRQTSLANLSISSGGQELQFKLPDDLDGDGDVIDANGAIEWGATVTYALEGDPPQLVRTQGASQKVLANGVKSVEFKQDSADAQRLNIHLVLERTTLLRHTLSADSSTEVRLRN